MTIAGHLPNSPTDQSHRKELAFDQLPTIKPLSDEENQLFCVSLRGCTQSLVALCSGRGPKYTNAMLAKPNRALKGEARFSNISIMENLALSMQHYDMAHWLRGFCGNKPEESISKEWMIDRVGIIIEYEDGGIEEFSQFYPHLCHKLRNAIEGEEFKIRSLLLGYRRTDEQQPSYGLGYKEFKKPPTSILEFPNWDTICNVPLTQPKIPLPRSTNERPRPQLELYVSESKRAVSLIDIRLGNQYLHRSMLATTWRLMQLRRYGSLKNSSRPNVRVSIGVQTMDVDVYNAALEWVQLRDKDQEFDEGSLPKYTRIWSGRVWGRNR